MGDFLLQEEAPDNDEADFEEEDDLPLSQVRKNVVEEHHRLQQLDAKTRMPTKAEVAANTREMEELLNQFDNYNPGIQTQVKQMPMNPQVHHYAHIPDQGAIIMSQDDFLETPRQPMEQQSMNFESPQNKERLDEQNFHQRASQSQPIQPIPPILPNSLPLANPNDPYQSMPTTSTQDQYYPSYGQGQDNTRPMYSNPMLGDQPMYQIEDNQNQGMHYGQNLQENYNSRQVMEGYQAQAGQMMYEPANDYPNAAIAQSIDQSQMQQIGYQEQYQQVPQVQQVQQVPQAQQAQQIPTGMSSYPIQSPQYPEPQQIQYRRLPESAQVVHQSNSAHEFLRTGDGRLIRVVRQQPVQRQIVQRLLYNPQTNSYQQVQMMEYPHDPYTQPGQRVIRVAQPPQQSPQPQMLPASMSQQQQLYQQRQQTQNAATSSSASSQQSALFPVANTATIHYNNGPSSSSTRGLSFNPPNIRYINPDGTPAEPPMSAYNPELKPADIEGMPTLETAPLVNSSPVKVIRQPPPRPKPAIPQLLDKSR